MSPEELKLISDVCKLVHSRLEYLPDRTTQGKPEHWQSHAERILASKHYRAKDDCDGFALTAADLLALRGFDRSRIVLEFCQMIPNEFHLAVTIRDSGEGDTEGDWMIDNAYPLPVRARHTGYKWIEYMRLSELGQWKEYIDGDENLPA